MLTPKSPAIASMAQAEDPVLAKVTELLTHGKSLQGLDIPPGLWKAYLKDGLLCRDIVTQPPKLTMFS